MGQLSSLVFIFSIPAVTCLRNLSSRRAWAIRHGIRAKPHSEDKKPLDPFNPFKWDDSPAEKTTLICGPNPPVNSSTKRERCPAECPLHVEDRFNVEFCDFWCVEATPYACKALDPHADVPDIKRGFCRPCAVQGCRTCMTDGSDRCATCQAGFVLTAEGACHSKYWMAWYVAYAVVGLFALVVVAWVIDVHFRPVINKACVEHALACRSRAKLRQPKSLTFAFPQGDSCAPNARDMAEAYVSSRALWPTDTNLCNEDVAGPGLMLSFRFQVVVILWALILGTGWLVLGLVIDQDLFRMGTRRYDSPRAQCAVIAWGYETQKDLMWVKVAYCAGAYLLTFVGALVFSGCQLRAFQAMDEKYSTHKDYTIIVDGLFGFTGADRLEEQLRLMFEQKGGHMVEAVSICWDMTDKQDDIMRVIEEDLLAMDDCQTIRNYTDAEQTPDQSWAVTGPFHAVLTQIENAFLSRPMQKVLTRGRSRGIQKRHDKEHRESSKAVARGQPPLSARAERPTKSVNVAEALLPMSPRRRIDRRNSLPTPRQQIQSTAGDGETIDINDLIRGLRTTGKAFVVFETEAIRDEVVRQLRRERLTFRGHILSVKPAHCEPDSVKWENLMDPTDPRHSFMNRVAIGLAWVLGGMFVWLTVFYMPFVVTSINYTYSHGTEPSETEVFIFGMVVCIGNAIMYTVCSEATDRLKFAYVRDHEVAYMMFYTAACVFNVLLDMVVTVCVAYYHLVGLDTRTYFGQTLDEVPTFTKLMTTYGMQRELANNVLEYSFPSTFLIPFLIEPIVAVYVPYRLMVLLVGSHKSIDLATAEAYLASIPFDLSRYADLHLNMILAALVLMFPGGFNLLMFFGLAGSHVWIYVYDHYRVLRLSPSFRYVSMHVDWWAQWMFCIPAGIIFSTFVFKYNQMVEFRLTEQLFGKRHGNPNFSDIGMVALVVGAFCIHIFVHTVLLAKVVPWLCTRELKARDESYKEVAKRLPCSWLTANPVGVIRSAYFYEHEPPISFCMKGKEHLLQKNVRVGQHFEDGKSEAEDFNKTSINFRSLSTWRSGKSSAPPDSAPETPR